MTYMIVVFRKVLPGLLRALYWCVGNAILGILPLLFLMALNSMQRDHTLDHKIAESLNDGAVMFLCCTICGAALIDFRMSKLFNTQASRLFELMAIYTVMLILVVLLCTNILFAKGDMSKINYYVYDVCQTAMIIFSSVFCLVIKTYLYSLEKIKYDF